MQAPILRLLQSAPTAAKIYSALQRAQKGDASALDYLRREGIWEAIDLVAAPGAGKIAKEALDHLREAYRTVTGIRTPGEADVIDGEYREVTDEPASLPWSGFLRRLFATGFGAHVILGPYGSGKTSLALKLAQRFADRHSYRVEVVNMYGDDCPAWAVPLNSATLVARMRQLRRYLDAQGVPDEGEDDEPQPALIQADDKEDLPPGLPPRGRVIVIDEAALGLTVGDPARKAALQALTQCRHIDWIVIYIAQWAGQLPLPLLGQSVKWVKKPAGDEQATDRDNPVVRLLWRDAADAFRGLPSSPWYSEPYRDPRAWVYCDCKSLNGGPGYRGLVPFTPPKREVNDS